MSKQAILRAIWRERFHVHPEALDASPSRTRIAFDHIWAPTETLLKELEGFPDPWLELWLECKRGHVILTHAASAYHGQWVNWQDEDLPSACFVCITDLLERRETVLTTLLNLFDHLLGNSAEPDQTWFSSGSGITSEIREASLRFQRIHELGYAHTELGVRSSEDYFAQTYLLYLDHPRELNRLDPLVYRLYRNILNRLPSLPKI